jgi:BlaI family transcriptional regulator, penicillinase repressor
MKITAAESRIMEALWAAASALSAEEVREATIGEGWSDATVRTLLGRLVKKKAAAQAKDGRRFLYRPLIARADYLHAESKGLVDRLFGGELGSFFAHFSQREPLSQQEIAELRRLIDELDDGR